MASTSPQTVNTMKHLRRGLKAGFIPNKFRQRAATDLSVDDVDALGAEVDALIAARRSTVAWAKKALDEVDGLKLAVHMEHLARTGEQTAFLRERRAQIEEHSGGKVMIEFADNAEEKAPEQPGNADDDAAMRRDAAVAAGCSEPGSQGCFSGPRCIRNWGRARSADWVCGTIDGKTVWWCTRDCRRAKGAA